MNIPPEGSASPGSGRTPPVRWIERWRRRYKKHPTVDFSEVRGELKTGDVILFHKTARTGFIDSLELDFVSPLFFRENEFRHSGIIVRHGDNILVLECAGVFHSGYALATYPTGGNGIRLVPLEPLLDAYSRDNGDPHFGVKFIAKELPVARVYEVLSGYGPVKYMKMQRSITLFLTKFLLPNPIRRILLDAYRHEMMCSEFVHSVLNKCGALADYPSKLVAPYSIENERFFRRLEIVPYSRVVRFTYPALETPQGA